ncbi:AAA family ATPase [Streptomyces anulatus]|uniref:AAA family ATPase n=1 Tax=Streptomyces anulatus TaxID=1892 RepID=UPI0036B9D1E7
MLIAMAGLPGAGKSSVAEALGRKLSAPVVSMGQTVIVDAVNAVEAARGQWRSLADRHDVLVVFIEVVCSDPVVPRRRLENA